MKQVIITGGAGFIGSHLCRRLLTDGFGVICIDNFITSNKKNIEELLDNPYFLFIEHDITQSFESIKGQLINTSYIYHLASPASPNKNSPRSYINYPIETLLVNSQGTHNMLELARELHARFVYASTSEVYGDPTVSPQNEDYWGNVNPNGIRSVYDEGKRFGEALTMAFVRKYQLDARIMRIFNTYGERMQPDDGRVVSNFIVQALSGQPLTIYGDGSQTRSFCYISDLLEGVVAIMKKDGITGEVINLGNPDEHTIKEIAELIKKLTHSNSEIVFEDLPLDDPAKRKPDITKAQNILLFSPKINLDTGLQKTIEYFKEASLKS